MNKQLVVAMTSIAMIASSCVSTPKNDFRSVASVGSPELEAIAAQGRDLDFASQPVFSRGRLFKTDDVVKLSAAPNLKLIDGQLLTDNDAAFDKKLQMIENAKEEIRMVYFIYSNDDSSSKINNALIQAAQRGVKVKLMVDYITNYGRLDLFKMLEREGKGKLKTFFYNFPNSQIIQDANYMTLPCPESKAPTSDECYNSKTAALNKMGENKKSPTGFSKLFLSGLYGKNATAIKVALGYGAQIDPNKYKSEKEMSEEDQQALLDFAKLVKESLSGNIIAKIKLSIAMTTYGATLNPIVNEVTGRLPIRSIEKNVGHGELWDHLSDYTHHKLTAVDREQFILGGRNIEDSYHMKQRVGSEGKYIFIDTDFWGKTAAGGAVNIEKAFDRLISTSMVASLDKVNSITPNDFIVNSVREDKNKPSASEMAVGYCVDQKSADIGSCALQALATMPGYKSVGARMDAQVAKMQTNMQRYDSKYTKSARTPFEHLSAADLQTAETHYIENVDYNKDTLQRVIGSKVGSEAQNGKNIQAAWYRGLENACKVSRQDGSGYSQENPLRVVFHTAYFLMPSGMVHQIARMMNNDYGDCSRVKIQFITNSALTTDLGPINVLARYQLGALFTHFYGLTQYEQRFNEGGFKYKRFFPTLEYYEYKKAEGAGQSLHTKTSLIGSDLIVGSANADVRSYYMDTNNSVLIRNAHEMNAKYVQFIDGLIKSGRVEDKFMGFVGKTTAQLRAENEYILKAGAERWHQEKRLTPDRVKTVLDHLDSAGQKIYDTTSRLILFRGEFDNARLGSDGPSTGQINKELNQIANEYDSMFKVF